jgi:hypothetical protein
MLLNTKLILHYVEPIKTNERGNSQNLQLMEPAQKDSFGDALGEDKVFDVRAYNKDLLKLPDLMKIRLGSVVKVLLYVGSKKVNTNDGRVFYQPYLVLKSIEVVNKTEKNDYIQN